MVHKHIMYWFFFFYGLIIFLTETCFILINFVHGLLIFNQNRHLYRLIGASKKLDENAIKIAVENIYI